MSEKKSFKLILKVEGKKYNFYFPYSLRHLKDGDLLDRMSYSQVKRFHKILKYLPEYFSFEKKL